MLVSPVKSPTFRSVVETKRSEPVAQVEADSDSQNVDKINFKANPEHKKKPNLLAISGWTAVGGFAAAALSGIMHYPKIHKVTALVGTVAAAAHVGMVYGHRHNHPHKTDVKA